MSEFIELELSSVRIINEEDKCEIANESPMLNKLRNLALVELKLCHSLPYANNNGASWTYPTLVNSFETVEGQPLNLNHEMKDNAKLLGKKVNANLIIGHMLSGSIAELAKDDEGNYPLIPDEPIPITVKAYIYKRAVPSLIERLKNDEKLKVSMECEYDEIGYIYDNKMYENFDALPDPLKGKKVVGGKKVVRVLGGLSPQGGYVSFWGCAILDKKNPADASAEVYSTIASDIGDIIISEDGHEITEESDIDLINLKIEENDNEISSIKKDIELLASKKLTESRSPFVIFVNKSEISDIIDTEVMYKTVQGISPESIGEIATSGKNLSDLELEIAHDIIGKYMSKNKEKTEESKKEVSYLDGSLDDRLAVLREKLSKAICEKWEYTDNWIQSVYDDYLVLSVSRKWKEGVGYINVPEETLGMFKVSYTLTGNVVTLGDAVRAKIKTIVVPDEETDEETETEEASNKENEQGESESMNEKNKEETATEEVVNTEEKNAEESNTESSTEKVENKEEATEEKNEEASENKSSEENELDHDSELASLTSRVKKLESENKDLRAMVQNFKDKEDAEKLATLVATRKERLSKEFEDIDDLLTTDKMKDLLENSDDEKFESEVQFLTAVAKKAKKSNKVEDLLPEGGNWKGDMKKNKKEAAETASESSPVKPFAPPAKTVSSESKNKFSGF